MVDVFISYSRRDRAQIEKLAQALEAEGFSVWWDHRIAGGAAFAAEIERALNGAKAVVVAWSINAVQSEWVIDEAGVAKKDGKLIPVRLDATHAPIGFRQYQEIDFSDWDGAPDADAFTRLLRSVSQYVFRRGSSPNTDLVEERAGSEYTDAIAVLPFDNLTGDPGQQFLVDGVHEALVTNLSKIGRLKVISRTSAKRYAGSDKSIREIGAELGVSKIVEGSVMRAGDEVRITVQLIDARADTHIWADSFDRDMTNILQMQRDIAQAIVEKISVVLTPAESSRLATASRVRKEAHEAYLKGMYHWYKLTPEDMQIALQCFEEALAADADYAPAHAGAGMVWAGVQQMGVMLPRVAAAKIRASIEKALSLDGGLFQAHFVRAAYLTWSAWDWAAAGDAYERAIDLNPNFPDTHAYHSHYLSIVGRFDEARTAIEKALNLDPFNPLMQSLYGADLMFWERYEEAADQMKKVTSAAPDHWLPYQVLRFVYDKLGREDDALSAMRKLYEILDKPSVVEALDKAEGRGYRAASGAAAAALAALSEKTYVMPTQVAFLYGAAGDIDQTAAWFERAYEMRDPEMPYYRFLSRFSDSDMSDQRTQSMRRKMNYPDLD